MHRGWHIQPQDLPTHPEVKELKTLYNWSHLSSKPGMPASGSISGSIPNLVTNSVMSTGSSLSKQNSKTSWNSFPKTPTVRLQIVLDHLLNPSSSLLNISGFPNPFVSTSNLLSFLSSFFPKFLANSPIDSAIACIPKCWLRNASFSVASWFTRVCSCWRAFAISCTCWGSIWTSIPRIGPSSTSSSDVVGSDNVSYV